jgi:hypothetical protein
VKGADQNSTPPDVTNWRDARIGLDQPWAPQFVQDEIKSAKARYARMFNQPSNRTIEFRILDDFYDGCGPVSLETSIASALIRASTFPSQHKTARLARRPFTKLCSETTAPCG